MKLGEQVLIESQTARTSLLTQTDVLDRVKHLSMLPDDIHVSVDMVATYFDVSRQTIVSMLHDHHEEFEGNGLRILRGSELNSLKEFGCVGKRASSLTVLSRRAVLLVGMMLRNSEVAKQVRMYLLDTEEVVKPANANTRAETLRWVAANIKMIAEMVQSPRERMEWIERIYAFAEIPNVHAQQQHTNQGFRNRAIAHPKLSNKWFACHDIAEKYGLYSINHNLHVQLVAAIIQALGALIPEVDYRPVLMATRSVGKPEALGFEYSERIAKLVGESLERADWPDVIEISGRRYKVMYRSRTDRGMVRSLA